MNVFASSDSLGFFRAGVAAVVVASLTLSSVAAPVAAAKPAAKAAPAAKGRAGQMPAAVAAPDPVAPAQPGYPAPPALAARGFLLIDVSANNQILAAKDIDAVMEPASLTKLMTAYLVFEALKTHKITLDQTFTVSEKAWKMPGSRMFITPNAQIKVEDLLKGMIVQSGNDATMALAEGIAGSEDAFVQHMNAKAKTLGMNNTGYRNPEGLTAPGHTTTARDMALLSTRLLADFPEYVGYYAIKEYAYPGTPEANKSNRNALLFRDPTVDGLKTGHTDAAGYNLIATAKRVSPAVPQGRRLLAIVFGTASEKDRANETQKLINWGYTAFEGVQLLAADQPAQQARVWKGQQNEVGMGSRQPIVVAVPAGQGQSVTTQIEVNKPLVAPLAADQAIGTLKASLNGQPVASVPLVALQAVPEAGFFGRLWDAIQMLFAK